MASAILAPKKLPTIYPAWRLKKLEAGDAIKVWIKFFNFIGGEWYGLSCADY